MRFQQIIKRAIDIVASSLILVALSRVLVLVALSILITEGWPIFYNSRRFIAPDKSIIVYKFRTMVRDAASARYRLDERFMRDGYLDIPLSCEVFSPIGRLIERSQLVEVPQLLNVISGQMSLIGNRPLPYVNLQLLKAHERWAERFESPAGISGIAQVVGKLNLEPAQRLALEVAYSETYRNGNILKCDLIIARYTLRIIAVSKAMPLAKAYQLFTSADVFPGTL
jgi:lipopolysaccharide/colanic/teichoic acid biosynthesis glycosyltransferase